jgi:hypothetical protein
VNAWDVPDPDWRYIQSMVINHGCVITAFSGGGIYKSCNGINLGGGGQTVRLYQGVKVSEMISCQEGPLRTAFQSGDCYMDPDRDHPGGGGDSRHCAPGDMCIR